MIVTYHIGRRIMDSNQSKFLRDHVCSVYHYTLAKKITFNCAVRKTTYSISMMTVKKQIRL